LWRIRGRSKGGPKTTWQNPPGDTTLVGMEPPRRIDPEPGQESVWDYPRPPRFEASNEHITIVFNEITVASSNRCIRVLETSHPPTYYIPTADFDPESIRPSGHRPSFCEWKGIASYFHIRDAAWGYPTPSPGWEILADKIAVYPAQMDMCTVDDEEVDPQPGQFYGGWITSRIVGPFKGSPGSNFW
jgi:uncharacterized protein (DUF427 family)